ncbi:UDP-glycosyltransferase UGT5-like isoform X2 [Onthophagus taurus]|uniref:UDP-glycosyltransferase UGT5-like isoform X2 n=1 Tax=Onthophagus taurus TaxID=166361 RepID=UPI0039BE62A9
MWFRLLYVLLSLNVIFCYKILALFPHRGKSHYNVFEPMLIELSKRSHQLTVINHFPQKIKIDNFEDINLNENGEDLNEVFPFGFFGSGLLSRLNLVRKLSVVTEDTCETLNTRVMNEFIRRKEKFDLVLTEHFMGNCYLGLMHFTGGSLIGLTSGGMVPWSNDYIGNPDNPAYIPILFSGMADSMNFFQRAINTVHYVMTRLFYKFLIDSPSNELARKYIDSNLPDLDTFAYNTSLILSNIHFTLHRTKPLVPGLLEIGGVHIGNVRKLPQNIEKWINESSEGVVYFSMGSMLIGHSFPIKKREMFQRAFSRLKHRVLWKWENDTMPGKPDNVMTQKWMPQFDILCHPNVKAFVAHGGLLGMTEAVHCGVPVVVMPQFGDQFTNARALEASGGGVILDFSTITEDNVYEALQKVLNPKFKKQAEELSARFKDRPMSPMDTAIYWIEYVARHKGAPHLKTAAVGMPFYQYLLLDVIAFLLVVFLSICLVSYYTLKMLLKCVYPAKVKKTKTN